MGIAVVVAAVTIALVWEVPDANAQEVKAPVAGQASLNVVGFTPDAAGPLRAADVLIGKPGPGSIGEALHLGPPVLTFDDAWTLPQERFSTRWLRELGLSVVMRSVREQPAAVGELLPQLHDFLLRVQGLDNRAIEEGPRLVAARLRATRLQGDRLPAGRRCGPAVVDIEV